VFKAGVNRVARQEGRVLVVEDEPMVLQLAADILEEDGWEVTGAASYREAMARLESCPDTAAVVTDIGLAGARSGIALARDVAARWPHMRIIVVSGQSRPAREDYPEQAIFFTKPYAPGALRAMVRQDA
jgi:two-component system, response regulator PdtaR